ncbi:hypothetical protein PULV_b0646 [Pseudoalteromonas ulvae UL12]|nr:hypothetical protein [Pseudoalteromonas ulvae UL12]
MPFIQSLLSIFASRLSPTFKNILPYQTDNQTLLLWQLKIPSNFIARVHQLCMFYRHFLMIN